MKARSSAQRKEAFKLIQHRRKERPLQLLLDMKVRWSSTFVMLTRAESQREVSNLHLLIWYHSYVVQAVNEFIYELGRKETNAEKRRKLTSLALNEDEWTQVCLFCNILQVSVTASLSTSNTTNDTMWALLQHADVAQQAFSSASTPTLHNALPTLEKLHAAWEKASHKDRYSHFVPALDAGKAKLDTYYQRSAQSDAHIMAMGKFIYHSCDVLTRPSPSSPQPEEEDGILREALASLPRFGHRRCCSETRESVLSIVYFTPLMTQTKFIDRFNEQNKTIQHFHTTSTSAKRGRRNMDDTDTESDDDDPEAVRPTSSWVDEWKLYINTYEVVPDDMGIIQWWGVRSPHFLHNALTHAVHSGPRKSLSSLAVPCARLSRRNGVFSL
jgi:hypothetical protein